jgi:hypothetical protein
MLKIELSRRDLITAGAVVVGVDLLFIIMTAPAVSLPFSEAQPVQLNSVMDFIKFQTDLKNEKNVATWYSSALLLLAGACALLNSRALAPSGRLAPAHKAGWVLVALLLVGLSADETAMVHETLAPLLNFINKGSQGAQVRVGAGDWITLLLPAIIVAAVGMLAFFLFVGSSDRRFTALTVAGVVCWAVAFFAESIEAGILRVSLSRGAEGLIEEGAEVVGTSLLLFGFVEHYTSRQKAAEPEALKGLKHRSKTPRSVAG